MNCPRCSTALKAKTYDGAQIEVCPECEGEWLPASELQNIVENHEEKFTPGEIAAIDGVNSKIFTLDVDEQDEMTCPHCQKEEMEHFNYGNAIGIVLHKCPNCGGIWTDRDQLKKVEELVDGWKEYMTQDSARYGTLIDKIELKEQQELDDSVSVSRFGFVNAVLRRFCE